jgi:putative DNA primase/helicase
MPLPWPEYPNGDSRHPCPVCDKGLKDRALGVTKTSTEFVAHCFRCGFVERVGGGVNSGDGSSRQSEPEPQYETLSDYWQGIWRDCQSITGIAEQYLRSRSCVIPPADGDLRWHPNLKHPSGHIGAALVALITDTATGLPVSLHRTWIKADGSKPVEPARLLAKGHRKQGGAIRLWPDDSVTYGLAIAEGIETALSLAHGFTPVWALIDAGNLADFPVLPGIEALTIAADNDPAGVKAAKACANRWSASGREVRIVMPATRGTDLNDMLKEAA